MSMAFCYVQERCTKCVWFPSRKVYVIDLSREATGNSESRDKTFLSVNISVTIRDNIPSNYMLLFVLWSGSCSWPWSTWFIANIPSPFKWNELHAITQKFKYSRTPTWKKVQTLRVYPSEEIKGRKKELRNISWVNLELLCLVQV